MSFNFCERCTSGSVLPGEPKGELRGDAYFAAGPAELSERNKSKAIVLLTDIFGLPLKNCKIIADQLAEKAGCDVWVPDQFAGELLCVKFIWLLLMIYITEFVRISTFYNGWAWG